VARATSKGGVVKRIVVLLALAVSIVVSGAEAQSPFPSRPITMLVPFAAGGPTDVTARIVAAHMSRMLGQPVVIENVLGEGGQRAVLRTMQAAPDGYTIVMGHMGTHGAAPAVYPNLKYDPITDFTPIGFTAGTPIVIVTNKRVPAHDLQSFVRYVREKGASLRMAHAGLGSVSHTTGVLLNSVLGLHPTMVGYDGTGPALNDLVEGKVDLMTDQIVNVAPKIEAGSIRALAIATQERSPALPHVATTGQAGLPQYAVSAWNGVFAPAATPKAVVAKLNAALVAALDDDNTRKRLQDLGAVIPERAARTPDMLHRLVQAEISRWRSVMTTHGPHYESSSKQ
jgi:tripartite-type tricarboxylate transporter receptor subunit TctC